MGNTGTVLDDGSVVAGTAGTGGFVPGGAEVTDGNADAIGIEEPSLGAGLADALGPDGASNIVLLVVVDSLASSVDDGVAFVALFADSFLEVELLAGTLDLAADSVLVEIVSI